MLRIRLRDYDDYELIFDEKSFFIFSKKRNKKIRPLINYKNVFFRLYKNGVGKNFSIEKLLSMATITMR